MGLTRCPCRTCCAAGRRCLNPCCSRRRARLRRLDGSSSPDLKYYPMISEKYRISGWTCTGNKPGRIDLHQLKCPRLQRRRFRHQRKPVRPPGRYGHLVQRQRGQIGEKCRETVNRQPVGSQFGCRPWPWRSPRPWRAPPVTCVAPARPSRSSSSNKSGARRRRRCHST